jgi:hypothetical protein
MAPLTVLTDELYREEVARARAMEAQLARVRSLETP